MRRMGLIVPVVLGVVTLVFLVLHLTPGDPALLLAGDQAPPEVVEQIRHQLGLDRPLWVQYGVYLENLLKGDLGRSVRSAKPVVDEIMSAFPNTLQLVVVAEVVSVLLGIPLGVVAAVRRRSLVDKGTMVLAVSGISLPIFMTGLVLIYFLGYRFDLLPITGYGGPFWTWKGFQHILLPAVTLGGYHVASLARVTRSSLLEVLGQEYIRTARAKGLGERGVIYRHALKNALLPVVTIIGYDFAHALGGTVVVETVFGWPGLGRMVWMGIRNADYPIIQGSLLVISICFAVVNLVVDLAYGLIDPRISYAKGAR